ncbi:sulfite exporter TauE/SafE family protein [Aeromicrobium duanguangcaii]|uniref:Probable membrane transporter protein n=1 Tax=Aeromicrobium duanguangcaii TaxID=2968086 RepID=A0ABY5KE23_9ACTN|nr:sulfite exporter TauE/SafE family protein [Aeromicrobium duanguangcaii]MCD9155219.1 sulfite exporter TauE/SafE family protein [Aeromicrobium duanguangcaii]MCL3838570.1 sulfite exporter TauE/SafE family protein [Aeromicrobium duanguangcaii]UUI68130.1 sulfite exporter TauE/SafE family protein [Aeromicrobium duanguangcaii]
MDSSLVAGAFVVGIVVGLTGMGGGALMTPMLVFFFNVPPLTAVSSDLVASAVMKPVGASVHLRRGTVNLKLVGWLCAGSVPAAFCGVLILRAFGQSEQAQETIKVALGVAILLSAAMLMVRAFLRLVERARTRDGRGEPLPQSRPERDVRPLPTLLLGIVGGLVVGMTSVGSGSLVIIGLMLLYPGLKASQLVGTDLVQAVPLVAAAAISHAIFGDLDLAISLPLIIGSVPGAYIGARLSARLPGGWVRRALAFVLLASGLKLIGVPTDTTGLVLVLVLFGAPLVWMVIRLRLGFPAFAMLENRQRRAAAAHGEADR